MDRIVGAFYIFRPVIRTINIKSKKLEISKKDDLKKRKKPIKKSEKSRLSID